MHRNSRFSITLPQNLKMTKIFGLYSISNTVGSTFALLLNKKIKYTIIMKYNSHMSLLFRLKPQMFGFIKEKVKIYAWTVNPQEYPENECKTTNHIESIMIRTVSETVTCPTEFIFQYLLSSALLNKCHDLILSSHIFV